MQARHLSPKRFAAFCACELAKLLECGGPAPLYSWNTTTRQNDSQKSENEKNSKRWSPL
jgi:hypothetical protein